MKPITIQENQRGLLFRHGRFLSLLGPGRYRPLFGKQIEVLPVDAPIVSSFCTLETLLALPAAAEQIASVEVGDTQLALHTVDGTFAGVLRRGRHAWFAAGRKHEFRLIDISSPEVDPAVPAYVFSHIPAYHYLRFEVAEYEKARLCFDRRLVRVLDAGVYYFWKNDVKVEVETVDTRLTRLDVSGQELLTADKVTVRINFTANYRITDPVRILTEIDDYREQLHVAAQLALRAYVGSCRLDELLENKEALCDYVLTRLRERASELCLEIKDAGVKDIILPGEIREIMNTVLIAEKRAQASVITRREEVASTRSLLNTAKLMEENPTLARLKELEYAERIFGSVGNLNVSAEGALLDRLTALLGGRKEHA